MLYLAYGSNMSLSRLKARLPAARYISCVALHAHALYFHKKGMDGSGKCDAFFTGDSDHTVHGVVYSISDGEKRILDRIEGLGAGYEEKLVSVCLKSGEYIQPFLYYATQIDSSLQPFDWYKTHVLHGARENGLPESYVESIAAVHSIADTHATRQKDEMSIYR